MAYDVNGITYGVGTDQSAPINNGSGNVAGNGNGGSYNNGPVVSSNNGGGGFFGALSSIVNGAQGITQVFRATGQTVGAAREITGNGRSRGIGGGYARYEQNQVDYQNSGLEAGIAGNDFYAGQYRNGFGGYGFGGYGFGGGFNTFGGQFGGGGGVVYNVGTGREVYDNGSGNPQRFGSFGNSGFGNGSYREPRYNNRGGHDYSYDDGRYAPEARGDNSYSRGSQPQRYQPDPSQYGNPSPQQGYSEPRYEQQAPDVVSTRQQQPAQQLQAQQPPAPVTRPAGTGAPALETAAPTPTVAAPASIPAAIGHAAAFHGHKQGELRIPMAQNQVHDIQLLLLANNLPVGSKVVGQPDDKNGDVTQGSLKFLAEKLGIDPTKMNFRTNSPEAQQFAKLAQESAAKLHAPAQVASTQPTVTPQQQAESARLATQQQQAAHRAAEERTRPHILVDLPNDLQGRATIKNLVGLASMTSGSGEEIEFNGPQGRNKDILKDYVHFVRTTMDARGMRTSGESAKETAGMILAAYNGIGTTDAIGDLSRLRMPNSQDITTAVDRMSHTVLNDGRIQSREFKLPAAVLQEVVNPVLPPSMQAALAQAQGIAPLPGANPRNADGTGLQGAGTGAGQPITR